MDYETAIAAVREGKHVRRAAWEEPPKFLTLGKNCPALMEDIDEESCNQAEAIYSVEHSDSTYYFPWQAEEDDATATDWQETEWLEPY